MDIKLKVIFTLLLPAVVLSGFRCSGDSRRLEAIPVTSFIDDCPEDYHDFGEMVSVGDPDQRFMISLPYSWDIRESYGDSLYGVFASNFLSIPKPAEDQLSLSVSGYTTEKELQDYFADELLVLLEDENTIILERGTSLASGLESPWVLFEMKPGIYVMVYYVKEAARDDIYLIQSVSYDTVEYKVKMCYLKQIINTFELDRMP